MKGYLKFQPLTGKSFNSIHVEFEVGKPLVLEDNELNKITFIYTNQEFRLLHKKHSWQKSNVLNLTKQAVEFVDEQGYVHPCKYFSNNNVASVDLQVGDVIIPTVSAYNL